MLQFSALLVLAAGGLAGYAWLSKGTGVTGTPGGLLALIGAIAAFGGLAVLVPTHLGSRRQVAALTVFATLLAAAAGWFLMQDVLALVIGLAGLSILVITAHPFPNRRAVVR